MIDEIKAAYAKTGVGVTDDCWCEWDMREGLKACPLTATYLTTLDAVPEKSDEETVIAFEGTLTSAVYRWAVKKFGALFVESFNAGRDDYVPNLKKDAKAFDLGVAARKAMQA